MAKKSYTPDQVIREITGWPHNHNYGLHLQAAKKIGIERQRITTLVKSGNRGVIPKAFLKLLVAAHQEGILSVLIERAKGIKIETEETRG
jgi:hypothetical protein